MISDNMKKNLKPTVVLGIICIVVALAIAGINTVTSSVIEEANAKVVRESLSLVMPDGNFDTKSDPLRDDAPETIDAVYTDRDGKGKVVILVTNKGYTGKEIGITAAIDAEGKIIKAVITKNEESIVPIDMRPMGDYGNAYTDATAETVTDVVTGATVKYTENAIKDALYDAFIYLGFAEEKGLPRTDSELIALAEGLIEGATGFVDITPETTDGLVKKIYREKGGKGYVVYTHTYAQYGGTLETETLIAIDSGGTIIGIDNIFWTVGHGPESNPPAPDEAAVEEFFRGFIGRSKSDVTSVELVTNATGTGSNVRLAVTEALNMIPDNSPVDYTARVVGIVIAAAALVGAVCAVIIRRKWRSVK